MIQHITYTNGTRFPVAVLIKEAAFKHNELTAVYADYLDKHGIPREDLIICSLPYKGKTAPAAFIKEQLEVLLLGLSDVATNYIYCADAAYFKILTGERKAEPHLGYCLPCKIKNYEHFHIILGVNHKSLLYNPANEPKLQLSLDTLLTTVKGTHQVLGKDIIHSASYPKTFAEIEKALQELHKYPALTCDIETFSLEHHKAGIGTCTFCWDQHSGMAFPCDYLEHPEQVQGFYGEFERDVSVRRLLREFLTSYKGKLIYHSATFDVKILVYVLWMNEVHDATEKLLEGLFVLTRDFDDTKIIAYLSTNSTAGNELSLKDLAHEYAGNWAQADIKDIRKIPLKQLLRYNLIDGLSTWYVHNKFYPIMQADQQENLYHSLMLPSQQTLIQTELTGMPLNPEEVAKVKQELEDIVATNQAVLDSNRPVKLYNNTLRTRLLLAANAKLKVKQHTIEKYADEKLNPNSGPQLQALLYDQLKLPVLDRTKGKQPATGRKTLDKLTHHTTDPEVLELLDALKGISSATKILNTFIPAFENAIQMGNGLAWLHGSFNLGGTVSGRLSSSNPNLQNIPAGSVYGKLIKRCFRALYGWLFCGADYNSLEDYISALTTRDPNKLKVYLDGYDGHCLRAYSYFGHLMPDIRQASENEKCFKLTLGDQTLYVKSTDTLLLLDGSRVTPEQYCSMQ